MLKALRKDLQTKQKQHFLCGLYKQKEQQSILNFFFNHEERNQETAKVTLLCGSDTGPRTEKLCTEIGKGLKA